MKQLISKKFTLPQVFFITDREEIKDIPVGIPFIFGDKISEPYIIQILEFEYLYQAALKTGYPFNFKQILKDNGYDIKDFWYNNPPYIEYVTEKGSDYDIDGYETKIDTYPLKEFIKDSSAYVDIEMLKGLNVFPLWLDKIEEAISTNIHNFAVFNNNMYNKKLEGMYGGLELTSPNRNLIIIDISRSIPKAVSATCLALAKNLTESFYADLLITGSKSTLYLYEEIYKLNIETIYEENGMDNDQVYFKKLVSETERNYKTAIVFGDNHSPCDNWNNVFNKGPKKISREDGKKLCKWNIEKLISLHTSGDKYTAGYADWFSHKEEERIKEWVKYLK